MHRSARIPVLLLLTVACSPPDERDEVRVEVGADELQQSFLADERAARERFDGRDLVIFGEVVHAVPRFRGTTMEGEVEVPSYVDFRTELDTLSTDLKYVQVEGAFDVPDSLAPWVVDPRIRVGDTLRVSCPDARIRWGDPALFVSECRISTD